MRADNSHHVIQAATRRAQQTRQRAVTALRRMDAAGQRITFDAVSREAGVSRSWLYAQEDLRAEIERLRQRHRHLISRRFLLNGNAHRIPRCCAGWKPPPPASATWKPTTSSSATPSPGRSANAGPPTSSAETGDATRRTEHRRNHRTLLSRPQPGPSTTPSTSHHSRSQP